MKTSNGQLLNFAFQDDSYDAFRAALFKDALGQLRQKRFEQRRNRFLALAACLLAGIGLLVFLQSQPPTRQAKQLPFEMVRSQPLGTEQVLTTAGILASASPQATVTLVHTDPRTSRPETISDEQLLASFSGQPVGLISVSPGRKQLRFLDPAIQATFLPFPPVK